MAGELAIFLIFGSIPAIIIYITRRRSQERMEMIKNGFNPYVVQQRKTPKVGNGDLKAGMIITAIGIGLAISASLIQRSFDRGLMTIATVLTLVGISMLSYWVITKNERERAQRIYEYQLEKIYDHTPQDVTDSNH